MSAMIKTRHVLGILGLAGFLLCAWFAYQCGLNARDSASRAYTLWLSGNGAPSQVQAASRHNGLWVLAVGASLLLGLVFLSACFSSKRPEVRRRGLGLLLLWGSCLPVGFAFTILSPLINLGGRLTPGARVTIDSWSSAGTTLQGWQMYAAGLLYALAALSMLAGGAYLLLSPPTHD